MEMKRIVRPQHIKDAYDYLINYPDSTIIGGGAWLKFLSPNMETGIDLSLLNLDQINETKDFIEIGAMATLYHVEKHPAVIDIGQGMIRDAIGLIMGVPFRNIATIGGSIFGKYAFSDLITPLLCLDVKLNFYRHDTMDLLDYLNTKEKINDILLSILIKKESTKGYFKKVSNTPLDFAICNIAVILREEKLYISVGARPGLAKLAEKAMATYEKGKIDPEKIAEITIDELHFGSNHLASDLYRKEVAKTYIIRGIKEVLNI